MRNISIAVAGILVLTGLSTASAQQSRQACEALARQRGMHEVHGSTQIERFVANCVSGKIRPSATAISRTPHANPAYNVYDNGKFIGADPDPQVRSELLRDEGDN